MDLIPKQLRFIEECNKASDQLVADRNRLQIIIKYQDELHEKRASGRQIAVSTFLASIIECNNIKVNYIGSGSRLVALTAEQMKIIKNNNKPLLGNISFFTYDDIKESSDKDLAQFAGDLFVCINYGKSWIEEITQMQQRILTKNLSCPMLVIE